MVKNKLYEIIYDGNYSNTMILNNITLNNSISLKNSIFTLRAALELKLEFIFLIG